MGLIHLVENSLPFLLGPAPRYAFLLNLAVAGCLFLCGFVPQPGFVF